MKRHFAAAIVILILAIGIGPAAAFAASYSGEVTYGNVDAIPAFDGRTGQEVFFLLASKATLHPNEPSSPIYLVMYPTLPDNVTQLECTPANCNHFQNISSYLDNDTSSVYPDGDVVGHNHILGVDATGQMHTIRHVYLALFTASGVQHGISSSEITTQADLDHARSLGYVEFVDTGAFVHASIVSPATYLMHQ